MTKEQWMKFSQLMARNDIVEVCPFTEAVKKAEYPAPHHLVAIARELRRSPWWTTLPVYSAPPEVSGEIEAR